MTCLFTIPYLRVQAGDHNWNLGILHAIKSETSLVGVSLTWVTHLTLQVTYIHIVRSVNDNKHIDMSKISIL